MNEVSEQHNEMKKKGREDLVGKCNVKLSLGLKGTGWSDHLSSRYEIQIVCLIQTED